MSSFSCQHCGTAILDRPGGGYMTGCQHYPLMKDTKPGSWVILHTDGHALCEVWSEEQAKDVCKKITGYTYLPIMDYLGALNKRIMTPNA